MKRVIADPASIFDRGFPASVRDEILKEARRHMAGLSEAVAQNAIDGLPAWQQTPENARSMLKAAKTIVRLGTGPSDLDGTKKILRAWIVRLETEVEPGVVG